MPLFRKEEPAPPCPACDGLLEKGHVVEHLESVGGGSNWIFNCGCGVSTMQWSRKLAAETAFEIHLDRDHGTSLSNLTGPFMHQMYREFFPSGNATQPSSTPAPPAPSPPPPAPTDSLSQPAGASTPPPPASEPNAQALFDYLQSLEWDTKRAASWDQMREILVRVNELSGQPLSYEEPRVLVWDVQGGGRTQMVSVSCMTGDQGPDWMTIESPCGPFHPDLAMKVLTKLGTQPELLGLGAALLPAEDPMPDLLAIRYSTTVTGETIRGVLNTIDAVAGTADRIESEVTGGADVL